MEKTRRPTYVKDEYLEFLDDLRDSGITNMMAAAPFLASHYNIKKPVARNVLSYWMESYGERHGKGT